MCIALAVLCLVAGAITAAATNSPILMVLALLVAVGLWVAGAGFLRTGVPCLRLDLMQADSAVPTHASTNTESGCP